MGLDLTNEGLLAELRASDEVHRNHMAQWANNVKRLVGGSAYRADWAIPPEVENTLHEWLGLHLPRFASGNPVCKIGTSRVDREDVVQRARALQFATNKWSEQTRMKRLNAKLATDWSIQFAVVLTSLKPSPGYEQAEDPPNLPAATRVSPNDFRWDPDALEIETRQWQAHRIVRSRTEVIEAAESGEEEGWDVDRLRAMGARDRSSREPAHHPWRDDIEYWELHIPDWKLASSKGPSKGFHGTIATISLQDGTRKDGWLREPRPYFGCRAGPYVVSGAQYVPDQSVPSSPTGPSTQQAKHVNEISRAIHTGVRRYKRVVIVGDASEQLAHKIKSGMHDGIVTTPTTDLAKNLAQAELFGVTDQMLQAKLDARQSLDRNMALSDSTRGQVTGDATATENRIAATFSSTRSDYLAGVFQDFVAEIMRRIAELFDIDKDSEIQLGPDAAAKLFPQSETPLKGVVFKGGLQKGEKAEDFESLDLRIDGYSMERTSEASRMLRMQALDNTLMTLMQLGPAGTFINVKRLLQIKADELGLPELEELVDVAKLEEYSQMLLEAGTGAEGQGPAQPGSLPQLRLETDRVRSTGGPTAGARK